MKEQSRSRWWNQNWFLGLLLVAVTLVVYQPAWHGQPVYDDEEHLTPPELRSLAGLARIWIEPGVVTQYYPVAHTAFWVEHWLWGDSMLGYHLVNILLHALSALLLARILKQLEVPGAWLAAAIFALHPVHAESVAYISELKNTLSGTFYLGSALAFLTFDRTRQMKFHAVAFLLFGLGLLSKTVIATLPAALLVVFWWKRGRLHWKRDVWPLLPFFLTGIVSGLFTTWVERKFIGATGKEFDFAFIDRCLIAGRATWFYLGKLFWPAELVVIYPHWAVSRAVWWQYLFPAAMLLVLAVLWALRRRGRGPLAGLLFFVGTLFPALGFFDVYPFRYSFVADHYQYLASLGVIAAVSTGTALLLNRWKLWHRPAGVLLCLALLAMLAGLTWRQSAVYADSETLWRTTIAKNPVCFAAYNNLGVVFFKKGQANEAITCYQKALQAKPDNQDAYNNLGNALLYQGRVDEAMAHYQKALALQPDFAEAHNNLGNALLQKGQVDEAINHLQKAVEIRPDFVKAQNLLANVLLQRGQVDEAIVHFQKALEFRPDDAEAHDDLGNALLRKGQVDEAISHYQKAVDIQPNHENAHYNLGNALFQKGEVEEATAHFQKAVELRPDDADAHDDLGNALLQKGRLNEAISHYQKAVELRPDDAKAHYNFGVALFQKGEVDAAIRQYQKALEIQPGFAEAQRNLAEVLLRKGPD